MAHCFDKNVTWEIRMSLPVILLTYLHIVSQKKEQTNEIQHFFSGNLKSLSCFCLCDNQIPNATENQFKCQITLSGPPVLSVQVEFLERTNPVSTKVLLYF